MSNIYDEIINDTLSMVNVVRQNFGKAPLSELPDARPGDSSDCLFYRALMDVGVTGVGSQTMQFRDERMARTVAEMWGTYVEDDGCTVRQPRQFSEVIHAFDNKKLSHYNTTRAADF